MGKELANFAARLSDIGKSFLEVNILGKFAGAVGNYNAHVVAYPEVDWPKVAEEFVRSLGLQFNPYVTQVIHICYFDIQLFLIFLSGLQCSCTNRIFPPLFTLLCFSNTTVIITINTVLMQCYPFYRLSLMTTYQSSSIYSSSSTMC